VFDDNAPCDELCRTSQLTEWGLRISTGRKNHRHATSNRRCSDAAAMRGGWGVRECHEAGPIVFPAERARAAHADLVALGSGMALKGDGTNRFGGAWVPAVGESEVVGPCVAAITYIALGTVSDHAVDGVGKWRGENGSGCKRIGLLPTLMRNTHEPRSSANFGR
jgi:hypothetical protein